MIPDISRALIWLEKNPNSLVGIKRGLERETLRVNLDGSLSKTDHPKSLGSALTHKWITTDFIEALIEFVTPVNNNINHTLTIMRDIHRYVARNLINEYMWPLSMPYSYIRDQEIKIAQYGSSNIGKFKSLYREGLKNRYGILMQIISGVHYNFSLPMSFWHIKYGKIDKEIISSDYFCLIRNYYRFGWIIPYLFGASPAVCLSFLKDKPTNLLFKKTNCGMYYLPYATSLRLSELGYTNKSQDNLGILFNELHEYVTGLKRATKTPWKDYENIGLEKDGKRIQINSNILQTENELYAPIRPKRIIQNDETLSDALQHRGIEYVEVRSLDINPFSPIGINELQVRFLDLFMIWCLLADSPYMDTDELICVSKNWDRVILEGRKLDLMISLDCSENTKFTLPKIGKNLFHDLKRIAKILDIIYGGKQYQKICDQLIICFDDPKLTFSGRILYRMIKNGIFNTAYTLAKEYNSTLKNEPLEILSESDFIKEKYNSFYRQYKIEEADNETFEDFLIKRKNF